LEWNQLIYFFGAKLSIFLGFLADLADLADLAGSKLHNFGLSNKLVRFVLAHILTLVLQIELGQREKLTGLGLS